LQDENHREKSQTRAKNQKVRQSTESVNTDTSEEDFLRQDKGDFSKRKKERREGHMKDTLALGGEEGRDKLR
jgi:hypothetical protein